MIATPIIVDVNSPGLDDNERQLAAHLSVRLTRTRSYLQVFDDYYNGEQAVEHLGIAIPDQLQAVHAAIGWPRLAVDVLDERLDVQGFRLPASNDADQALWDIWTANQMDQESQLAHVDAFVFGRAFGMAGSGNCGPGGDCPPLLTVESPMNMVADFDARSRQVTDALQAYEMEGNQCAALYLPNSTAHLIQVANMGTWQVYDRDDHNLGLPPVVMLANRARSHDRYGRSEITPEVMAITDAAIRTLLGMEFAREFFGAPQRYILGASEGAFVNPDGTPTRAWEAYIGRILALERDDSGELPQVGTFTAADPTAYTNILLAYSRIFSSITGLPPHLVGFAADNPASAEGIRSAEARLDKRALRKQRSFEGGWRDLMKLALMIQNNGELPADAHKLDVLWADPATPTPVATAEAIYRQVQMGYLPGSSEVTGEKLGYSAVERARIAADRKVDAGASVLAELASSLQAKEARVDSTVANDINPVAAKAPVSDTTPAAV